MRLTIFLLLVWSTCCGQITGKVISISDGDTFTLLTEDKRSIKIRLHGIDCPEKTQDFGQVAKEFLSNMVFGKNVDVRQMDIDRYGRTIAMVTVGAENVNESLLTAGLAWHYKHYDKNPRWAELEDIARKANKGLWVQPQPTPPWEYRRINR